MNLSKRLLISFGAMLGLVLLLSAAALLVTRDLGGELDRAANVTARAAISRRPGERRRRGVDQPGARDRAGCDAGRQGACGRLPAAVSRARRQGAEGSGGFEQNGRIAGGDQRACRFWISRRLWSPRRTKRCGRRWRISRWMPAWRSLRRRCSPGWRRSGVRRSRAGRSAESRSGGDVGSVLGCAQFAQQRGDGSADADRARRGGGGLLDGAPCQHAR